MFRVREVLAFVIVPLFCRRSLLCGQRRVRISGDVASSAVGWGSSGGRTLTARSPCDRGAWECSCSTYWIAATTSSMYVLVGGGVEFVGNYPEEVGRINAGSR